MTVVGLISRQRSGTSALGSALGKVPNVHFCGEILYPPGAVHSEYSFYSWLHRQPPELRYASDFASSFEIYTRELADSPRVFILDLKINTLSNVAPDLWSGLRCPWPLYHLMMKGHAILRLKRASRFQTFLSGALAQRAGRWHRTRGHGPLTDKVSINRKDLLDFYAGCEIEDDRVDAVLHNYPRKIDLVYEDIFVDGRLTDHARRDISGFLGLHESSIPLMEPDFEKQASSRIEDHVSNLAEVEDLID